MDPDHPTQLRLVSQALAAMPVVQTLGLRCLDLRTGQSEWEMPYSDAFSHAPGVLQATPVFAIADFAAVSAAATTLPVGGSNATTDTTLKLVAPAQGRLLRARGRVISVGRSQTVCASEVYSIDAMGEETLCATLLATATNRMPAAQKPQAPA
jgi:uncharacterized protein (TIGR00369 family)